MAAFPVDGAAYMIEKYHVFTILIAAASHRG